MTKDQARAWFRSTDGKVGSFSIEDHDLDFRDEGEGIYELGADPCCDIGHLTIAYFYACKVYSTERLAVHDLLMTRGWASATPATRVELAKVVDRVTGDPLATAPKDWNPYKPFTAPTAEAQPDGTVKLRRWVHRPNCGGQGCAPTFAFEETLCGSNGLGSSKTTDEYSEEPKGYPDPTVLASCDPTKPPSKDYAHAVYLAAHISNFPWEDEELEDLGHDMWLLRPPRKSPAQYLWHCKHAYEADELLPAVEAAEGWDKADAQKRAQLALMFDGWRHHVVTAQPATWDATHAFAPPTTTPLPDGGIRLARWYANFSDDSSALPRYYREEQEFQADGKLGARKVLDQFQPAPAR
ncbi:MAG: hypothetical protein JO257_34965 [Deltaproteobacteria bacterium]|nr:hypothetical protein [Deltaproteobacteria bacterium]